MKLILLETVNTMFPPSRQEVLLIDLAISSYMQLLITYLKKSVEVASGEMKQTNLLFIVIQLCLRSWIALWNFFLLCTIWYHALLFFQYGVYYKYCCLVYWIVWCEDEVRSANCARTMQCSWQPSASVFSFIK